MRNKVSPTDRWFAARCQGGVDDIGQEMEINKGGGLQEAKSAHGTFSDFIKAGSCHRGHRWAQ